MLPYIPMFCKSSTYDPDANNRPLSDAGCRLTHVTQLLTKRRSLTLLLLTRDFLGSDIGILHAA
jgi:hypothetical protein